MVSLLCESVCVLLGGTSVKNISDNIHTERVSLWCESVCVLSGQSYLQHISDNIHTDVVSLLCESECGWLGCPSVQNISDNIHTDKVSLFEYESEWKSGEDASFHKISENSHIDYDFHQPFFHHLSFHKTTAESNICASQHVSAVCPSSKSSFGNKCRQTVLMKPWSNNKINFSLNDLHLWKVSNELPTMPTRTERKKETNMTN